ncbi:MULTISPECIES: hypothetical protein [Morganella]|uniref:Uncharacterized protein n=1 Tax=Morganella morganii TaxID=582 RepID=A0AAN5MK84_MORMO|nr:hypothetical protein [Morganella morganii]EBW9216164.1 hypothetical protein [Salmonella enterica subsp. enterica serovar Typhimurium]ECG4848063.1 hypothetical protein [Salmonella enterica subsp. enterica serovar Newport]HAT3810692.1 hypothetical protein [Morganella morganii]
MSYKADLKEMMTEMQEIIHNYVGNNAKTKISVNENRLSISIGIEGVSDIDISISKNKPSETHDTKKQ